MLPEEVPPTIREEKSSESEFSDSVPLSLVKSPVNFKLLDLSRESVPVPLIVKLLSSIADDVI